MTLQNRLAAACFLIGCLGVSAPLRAQQPKQEAAHYDQHKVFGPIFYTYNGNEYRSASGQPGPAYWQNRADYQIQATLDTTSKTVTGTVTISYLNNSPDPLDFLWLQLDQNIYRKNSRGEATSPVEGGRFSDKAFTKGDELKSVTITQNGKTLPADYIVSDTRMQIRLGKQPLKPKGGSLQIHISYRFHIPRYGTDRMGRLDTRNGWIYEIAQWYPRMEVYDDVLGWNTLPYLGAGEFYLEYGNIDYRITAPADMVVVGSGALLNPTEVLSPTEISRLNKARNSDATVMIHDTSDAADPGRLRPRKGDLTWHFRCIETRDVSWAASTGFVWDAARINLPGGKKALAQSVYPVESAGPKAWGRSTEMIKGAIELYSREWYPFPYPVATDVAGTVNGMEYPGIVFCSYRSRQGGLWNVANHEFGHTWFPMIVGSNERKYGWMDEGFNTFINGVDTKVFNHGEFNRKQNVQGMASFMFGPQSEAIMNLPDVIQNNFYGVAAYFKPALALHLLRKDVLGKDRFDYAFRTYIKWWAYKHPTPWDFFRTMDNAGGEDLSWFWKEWFLKDYSLDQAVSKVSYLDHDTAQGALITLKNLEGMAMPVILVVQQSNGEVDTVRLPVEIWQRGGDWTFRFASTRSLTRVEIDPDHTMPDINPDNNIWIPLASTPVPAGLSASDVLNHYLDAIGGSAKLRAVKDLSILSTGNVQGQKVIFKYQYKVPGLFLMDVSLPGLSMNPLHLVMNQDSISLTQMGHKVPVTPQRMAALKSNSVMFPELDYQDSGYQDMLAPMMQDIGGKLAYLVTVTSPEGRVMRNYYDTRTGLKIKTEIPGTGPQPTTETILYGNYQVVQGISFPFRTESNNLGQDIVLKTQELKVNSGLPDSDFK